MSECEVKGRELLHMSQTWISFSVRYATNISIPITSQTLRVDNPASKQQPTNTTNKPNPQTKPTTQTKNPQTQPTNPNPQTNQTQHKKPHNNKPKPTNKPNQRIKRNPASQYYIQPITLLHMSQTWISFSVNTPRISQHP
ncbi:hypothetical protein J6590_049230 [Homalodisca vitripennis]|nr:hypothetical protein J6590_049230 [Homalodisca vitripennis]